MIKRCPLSQLHQDPVVCLSMYRRTDGDGNRMCTHYNAETTGCNYDWIPIVCR